MPTIKILGADVTARGLLIVTLSAKPSPEWRRFFEQRWKNPAPRSSAFDPSIFDGWEDGLLSGGPGPVFKKKVEEFDRNYKSIVIAAVEHANREMKRFEDEQLEAAKADAAKEQSDAEELERERQKARAIKFP